MAAHFDDLETVDPAIRESRLFERLPRFLIETTAKVPGLRDWLSGIDLASVNSHAALARLPVLRKPETPLLEVASTC